MRVPGGDDARPNGDGKIALPIVWFDEVKPVLATNDFVEGLLISAGMSVLYGESGSCKTFFALNLGLHVALGWPWFGRACDVGPVIYVAGEGAHGIKNRIAAFRQHHGLEDASVPFGVIPSQVNLLDPAADVPRLIAAIQQAAARWQQPVRLVIVDTLSRALFGGNENAPDDMGALVANADAVRQATSAHVLFVHHRGKDETRGMRGHSLLLAAIDTEIEIERDAVNKTATATVKKQRDLESAGVFPFRLDVVELGLNSRGKVVTSCAVAEIEPPAVPIKEAKLDRKEAAALEELRKLIASDGEEYVAPGSGSKAQRAVKRKAARARFVSVGIVDAEDPTKLTGTERSRISRIIERLRQKGRIGISGDWLWVES